MQVCVLIIFISLLAGIGYGCATLGSGRLQMPVAERQIDLSNLKNRSFVTESDCIENLLPFISARRHREANQYVASCGNGALWDQENTKAIIRHKNTVDGYRALRIFNAGLKLEAQHHDAEATSKFEEAIQILSETGDTYELLAASLNALGAVQQNMRLFNAAKSSYAQAAAIAERVYNTDCARNQIQAYDCFPYLVLQANIASLNADANEFGNQVEMPISRRIRR
jgi:hypothetical protein